MNVARSVPVLFRGAAKAFSIASPSPAFDDLWGWWRADYKSGLSPAMALPDLSGNGRTMRQQAGTLTAGTSANGQASVTGNSTARLDVSGSTLPAWPLTVVTFCKRTAGQTCGLFGASGTNPFNNNWYGWEASNAFYQYNSNASINTDSTGGSTGCYVSRVGYGSRVPHINGIILDTQTLSSIARPTALAPSIGTQYRGLNCEWQETLAWNRCLSIDELDEIYAYGNARYGLSIPLWSSYTPVPTIWLGGQSNAAGRGDRGAADVNIPAEYLGPIANANVFHAITAANVNYYGVAWETLDNQAVKNGYTGNHMLGDIYGQPSTYIGCESALCKEYLDLNGGSIYLMKNGTGGSNLEYVAAAYHWDPTDNTMVHNNQLRVFGMNGANWWKSMREHQQASRRPSILGLIWYQGEQDASNLTYANAYAANLAAFIPELRRELGYNAKAFICRLNDECPETYAATVRAAQSAYVATDANSQLVDTDSFEIRSGDPVHLSHNGQVALGQYLATQL